MATDANTNSAQQPPPKKKRKRYHLIKVPNWVANEWFGDNSKHVNGARVGELYVTTSEDKKKTTMKLELTQPLKQTQSHNNNSNNYVAPSPMDKWNDIPIPSSFKMEQRQSRNRVNVKHGSLTQLGKDKLLIFHDRPPFPIGSEVEALDNSRNTNMDNEDDDIAQSKLANKSKKRKNVSSSIKGYAKGVIKEINDNRTFTVEFSKSKKQRYNVPERDIRFADLQNCQRANKCKLLGQVIAEIDVTPEWTPQYKEFLALRSMKKSFQQFVPLHRYTLHIIKCFC